MTERKKKALGQNHTNRLHVFIVLAPPGALDLAAHFQNLLKCAGEHRHFVAGTMGDLKAAATHFYFSHLNLCEGAIVAADVEQAESLRKHPIKTGNNG